MTKARYATALTGGTAGALDAKAVATLSEGDIAFVATGSVLYVYRFVAAATDAESSPSRIRPDDYATAGVWYLQNVSADYSQMVRNDIDGGDITTSSQVITVTPCSCWDSTRGTFLQTLVNKTWTVAATNNLEVYLFLVRLNNGTIDVKGYSSYAAAASDVGVNITHWRFISWAKNNGSGVLMPYRQVGPYVQWIASNTPVITSSLTTSFVSYSLSAIVPVSILYSIGIQPDTANVSAVVELSYDGSNILSRMSKADHSINPLDVQPVDAIYMKYYNATTAVCIRSITLRR